MITPNFYCVFGGAPIESRDGESLEGVGETRLTTGTMQTDQLFTGQREMAGLGIYHYGARFYSPKLGRFLSADTIVPNVANPQDFNRYSYVRNNPLRYADPSGNIPIDCWNDPTYCSNTTTLPSSPYPSRPPQQPGGGNNNNNNNGSTTSTPTPSCTSPTNVCATSNAATQITPTVTPSPTQQVGICDVNMYCPTHPLLPYNDYDLSIDWSRVDILEAVLDVAGIGADIFLLVGPRAPGAVVEGAVTVIELASAANTLYDAAGGDFRNLSLDTLVYSVEHNPYIIARAGRWVPVAGSIGSGFSLYENFSDAVTITRTVEYR